MKRDAVISIVRKTTLVLAVANTALTTVLFCYSSAVTWPYDDYLIAIQLYVNFALTIAMVFTFIAKKRTGLRKRLTQAAFGCACLCMVAFAPLLRNIKDQDKMCQAQYNSIHPCNAQLFLSVSQIICMVLLGVESYLNFKAVKAEERRKIELGLFTLEDLQNHENHETPTVHRYNPDLALNAPSEIATGTIAAENETLPVYQKTAPSGCTYHIVDMTQTDPPPHHDFGDPQPSNQETQQPLSQ
ncbi:hypothetical protein BG005_004913 [Podila minutissima]|nr:hypothetical protein BG005_004913 [Podila minutissima]